MQLTTDPITQDTTSNENNTEQKFKKQKLAEKIKRPMNSFMIWSTEQRKEISKKYPKTHPKEISKYLGEKWKNNVSQAIKDFYKMKADESKMDHSKKYRNYKHKPRPRKKKINSSLPPMRDLTNLNCDKFDSLIPNVPNPHHYTGFLEQLCATSFQRYIF